MILFSVMISIHNILNAETYNNQNHTLEWTTTSLLLSLDKDHDSSHSFSNRVAFLQYNIVQTINDNNINYTAIYSSIYYIITTTEFHDDKTSYLDHLC